WQAAQGAARLAPRSGSPAWVVARAASAPLSSGATSTGGFSGSGSTVDWANATAPATRATKPAKPMARAWRIAWLRENGNAAAGARSQDRDYRGGPPGRSNRPLRREKLGGQAARSL